MDILRADVQSLMLTCRHIMARAKNGLRLATGPKADKENLHFGLRSEVLKAVPWLAGVEGSLQPLMPDDELDEELQDHLAPLKALMPKAVREEAKQGAKLNDPES